MGISNTPITRMANADEVTLTATGTTLSIKNSGVTVTQLADDAVETLKIKNANVTPAKLSFNAAQRIAYSVLSSPDTNITISSLDLETDHIYKLVANICNTGTGGTQTIALYFNGDTTATNYDTQYLNADTSTVSAARSNNANLITIAEDQESLFDLTISKVAGSEIRVIGSINNGTSLNLRTVALSPRNTTNLTSLTINASRNMRAGTSVSLYKMV